MIRSEFEREILITLPNDVLAEIQDLFPDIPLRQAVAAMAKHGMKTWKLTHDPRFEHLFKEKG